VCESTFSTTKQVKSKKRNRTTDEILDDSLRVATMNILVLLKEQYCQWSLNHRHPTDRDW